MQTDIQPNEFPGDKRTDFTLDLEKSLMKYMPSLFPLIGHNPFPWATINKVIKQNFENRLVEYDLLQTTGNVEKKLIVQSNLFDVIVNARKGDPDAIRLFTYFNLLLLELNINLPAKQNEMIRTILKGMFTDIDRNYRNYVGELSVLNNCLKSDLLLLDVEYLLPNGKRIDFHFQHKVSKKFYLFEVVNIHYNEKKEYTDETLAAEIKGKLISKILNKAKNEDQVSFYLIPVIWATYDQLKRIHGLLDIIIGGDQVIWEPMAFCSYTYSDGEPLYKFGTLGSLLI